jgi:hypothetical protein
MSRLCRGAPICSLRASFPPHPPRKFSADLAPGERFSRSLTIPRYSILRATADGSALLAVQDLILDAIEVLPPKDPAQLGPLNIENQDRYGLAGLAWTQQRNNSASPCRRVCALRKSF